MTRLGDPFQYVRGTTTTKNPAYFAVRLCKGGPRIALKIYYGPPSDPLTGEPLDRSPRWQVWLSGELQENHADFIVHFQPDGSPVVVGEEISAEEHEYLLQLRSYAVEYDATMPESDPKKPVNLRQMAPIKPPK